MSGARLINPAKARMAAGEIALGMISRFARSGEIARIAKTSGHDFLFIDGQHSLYSRETINHLIQAALGVGVAPLVRVSGCHDAVAPILLDCGALGIVYPDVNTADDARAAVAACKFAPVGRRSVGGGYPQFNYQALPVPELTAAMNDAMLVVCMIETREGIANVEEIAEVEGVDVLLVGMNDLITDMGLPGGHGHPEVVAAVERVLTACRANGVFGGVGGDPDLARMAHYVTLGARFLPTQSDGAFLLREATRYAGSIRGLQSAIA